MNFKTGLDKIAAREIDADDSDLELNSDGERSV